MAIKYFLREYNLIRSGTYASSVQVIINLQTCSFWFCIAQ